MENDLDFHMNSILKDKIESVTTTRSTPVKGEDIVWTAYIIQNI